MNTLNYSFHILEYTCFNAVLTECSYTHNWESCSASKLGNFFGRTLYASQWRHPAERANVWTVGQFAI